MKDIIAISRQKEFEKADKKMRRQGLKITPKELWDLCWKLLGEEHSGWDRKFQINIINKEGLSDTWEVEKI